MAAVLQVVTEGLSLLLLWIPIFELQGYPGLNTQQTGRERGRSAYGLPTLDTYPRWPGNDSCHFLSHSVGLSCSHGPSWLQGSLGDVEAHTVISEQQASATPLTTLLLSLLL